MAGLSKLFFLAGYKFPKYMLNLGGKSVFCHVIESFSSYFNKIPFLFVVRDINNTRKFVVQECKKMGLVDYSVIVLDALIPSVKKECYKKCLLIGYA